MKIENQVTYAEYMEKQLMLLQEIADSGELKRRDYLDGKYLQKRM
jgi:hypothetical protein